MRPSDPIILLPVEVESLVDCEETSHLVRRVQVCGSTSFIET